MVSGLSLALLSEPGAEAQRREVGQGLPSKIRSACRVAGPVRDVAIVVAERVDRDRGGIIGAAELDEKEVWGAHVVDLMAGTDTARGLVAVAHPEARVPPSRLRGIEGSPG